MGGYCSRLIISIGQFLDGKLIGWIDRFPLLQML